MSLSGHGYRNGTMYRFKGIKINNSNRLVVKNLPGHEVFYMPAVDADNIAHEHWNKRNIE